MPDDEEARPPTDNTGMAYWTRNADVGCSVGQRLVGAAPALPHGVVTCDGAFVRYGTNPSNCDLPFGPIGFGTNYTGKSGPKGLKWERRGV